MSLLQEYMEPCQLLEKKRVPDGEGGFDSSWTDGAEFNAAVECNTSLQARTAEKQGVNAVLEYHDVFRRLRVGKIFRVTSDGDDVRTPERASFQVSQVTAEEWELPGRRFLPA